MTRWMVFIGYCLFNAIAFAQTGAEATAAAATEKIGVYDSRAIAVAYGGSRYQRTRMLAIKEQMRQARAAGNRPEAARIEADAAAWQATLHRQAFEAAPVGDILGNIAAEQEKTRQSAGVSVLVSKWNREELARHPQAERVDVTMALVDAFHPNPRQLRHAVEIQAKDPPGWVK